jgi:hypothetical protein
MNSLKIEISRPGSMNNMVLNEDTKYISLCGTSPQQSFSIDCGQDTFYSFVNELRYDDADPNASAEAITFFKKLTTNLFEDIKFFDLEKKYPGNLHIRLVTTPLELAQVPFEFVTTPVPVGIPLLANPMRIVTLTREVRQELQSGYTWPHLPRVLFAWAMPGDSVPHQEHYDVLAELLKALAKPKKNIPYPEADLSDLLTELPNVSCQSLNEEIVRAANNKNERPYTHIHILAHGGHLSTPGGFQFRLIFCKKGKADETEKVDGKNLSNALLKGNEENIPTVVSLSACDSGNTGNSIMSTGSLVYQLHNAGIPCVFASQFPLTQPGSLVLAKTLYHQLVNACDPRIALYKTRMELNENKTHDWASLIAYARFPENIDEQLEDAELKMLFAKMKISNAWVDHLFSNSKAIAEDKREDAFLEIETRINKSIDSLDDFLNGDKKGSTLSTALLRAEHLGLLGSAYKRKAEYVLRKIEFEDLKKDEFVTQSLEMLKTSRDFYYYGFDASAASHWNAMQYLSLKAVFEGSLEKEAGIWYVIKYMAEKDSINAKAEKDRNWAFGTLAELYMLKPLTVTANKFDEELKSAMPVAKEYLRNIAATNFTDVKESTAAQLQRYITWWPKVIKSVVMQQLKSMATSLHEELV